MHSCGGTFSGVAPIPDIRWAPGTGQQRALVRSGFCLSAHQPRTSRLFVNTPRASGAPRMFRQIADADRPYPGECNRVIILDGASADTDGAPQNALFVNDGQTAGKCNQPII